MYDWTIVGIFDAGNTAFNSEVWGDAEQLMQAFRRPVFSSVIFKLRDPSKFDAVRQRLEGDPRLTVDVEQETRYYLKQSEMMAKFLRVLGISLTIIFSLGATIGAMITMYAAVATRTGEIGTLRAFGFQADEHSRRLPVRGALPRPCGRRRRACFSPPSCSFSPSPP